MYQENISWDFFLSYPDANKALAEALCDQLSPFAKVFLATRTLVVGDDWRQELVNAQHRALITVAIITPQTKDAHNQKIEINTGINLVNRDKNKHHFVPILSGDLSSYDLEEIAFGLGSFHCLDARGSMDFSIVASKLLELLRQSKRTSWEHYSGLFEVGGYRVAYIPLINKWNQNITEFAMKDVEIQRDSTSYKLPKEFRSTNIVLKFNHPSCRLFNYDLTSDNRLFLTFAETSYKDYLQSGEHLDLPLPNDKYKTLRDDFGRLVRESKSGNLILPDNLTNICGVGIFVITKDDYIIATKHSENSHVYPGRWTFSASGTMKWGAYPHPFTEVLRKSFQEIWHQINFNELRLIGFGADARKLYFQFSFVERTSDNITEVKRRFNKNVEFQIIRLHPEPIAKHLLTGCWEPAAEAALLTLLYLKNSNRDKNFKHSSIENTLTNYRAGWRRREMMDEWDFRASRSDLLPDMSVRYPLDKLSKASEDYINAVIKFLENDVVGKDVLEIGAGTGRITNSLVNQARSVTCIDICERMIQLNKKRLKEKANAVKYVHAFAQDYNLRQNHEVVICSLVLIHNVDDSDFQALVRKIQNVQKVSLFLRMSLRIVQQALIRDSVRKKN